MFMARKKIKRGLLFKKIHEKKEKKRKEKREKRFFIRLCSGG